MAYETIAELYHSIRRDGVPRQTALQLANFLGAGSPCSGFLSRFLSGDTFGAALNADLDNEQTFVRLCRYVSNDVPTCAFGTPGKYRAWIRKGGWRLPAERPKPEEQPRVIPDCLTRPRVGPLGYAFASADADCAAEGRVA